MGQAYQIQYAQAAADDLRAMRAFDARRVLTAIEQYLTHNPKAISKRRIKRMLQPFWSQFRLRVGSFRVYYDVDDTALVVNVLRVLAKGTGPTPQEPP